MHVGLFCLEGTGHIYPMAAVGRAIVARGHRVSFFQGVRARAQVKASGLDWQLLGTPAAVAPRPASHASSAQFSTPALMTRHALTVLSEAPDALRRLEVDALVVDQGDLASGSVAERLGLPFVTVSFFPPVYLDAEVPPFIVGWEARHGLLARLCNRAANRWLSRVLAPVLALVNRFRREWNLPEHRHLNDTCSPRALIAQLPECLDFPRTRRIPQCHYVGLLQDGVGRYPVAFPWQSLNGLPLVYASMGTVRNQDVGVFRQIAEGCADLPVQLVLSAGGGVDPTRLSDLPGGPLVVHYAPQLDVLARAALTITHGGLNTTLESLAAGVPLVTLPVTDDQPGVSARVRRAGVGVVLPVNRLTPKRLRDAVTRVLTCPAYGQRAKSLQQALRDMRGPQRAAEIVERVCDSSSNRIDEDHTHDRARTSRTSRG